MRRLICRDLMSSMENRSCECEVKRETRAFSKIPCSTTFQFSESKTIFPHTKNFIEYFYKYLTFKLFILLYCCRVFTRESYRRVSSSDRHVISKTELYATTKSSSDRHVISKQCFNTELYATTKCYPLI